MPDLPALTPRETISALQRAGFRISRQRGSHATMFNPSSRRVATVPIHPGDLPMRTLRSIIKQAGLSVDEFIALL